MKHLVMVAIFCTLGTSAVQGEVYSSGIMYNDTFDLQNDRWQTGSYQKSLVFGQDEFRLRTEISAPSNLERPDTHNDRVYASILSLGYYKHHEISNTYWNYGITLNAVGSKTQLHNIQNTIHKVLGLNVPIGIDETIIGNDMFLGSQAEIGMFLSIGGIREIVPYFRVETGIQDKLSIGADFVLVRDQNRVLIRDRLTEQPIYEFSDRDQWEVKPFAGLTYSYVASDYALDHNSSNVQLTNNQYKLRGGIYISKGNLGISIAPTIMSPEFRGQSESQLTIFSSVSVNFMALSD